MILPSELLALIKQGESHTVEFKKSSTDITKDVYETVCSFSNRDGGHSFPKTLQYQKYFVKSDLLMNLDRG